MCYTFQKEKKTSNIWRKKKPAAEKDHPGTSYGFIASARNY
jgi:hypothetical protein